MDERDEMVTDGKMYRQQGAFRVLTLMLLPKEPSEVCLSLAQLKKVFEGSEKNLGVSYSNIITAPVRRIRGLDFDLALLMNL